MNIENKKNAVLCIEQKFGCKLEELKEITDIIYKNYKNIFCAKKICGESNFYLVAHNVNSKDVNAFWTITEKCMKRQYDIDLLDSKLKNNNIKLNEMEEIKALTDIIERLLPLEIFWSMEEQKEDGYSFNEHEQKCYDFLEAVASYYLDETEQYEKMLSNFNNTLSKDKILSLKNNK